MQTLLHVRFVVEIWHLPAVFFVVVVMRVCRMVARRDAFSVRRRRAVIEVHLRPVLIRSRRQHLLRLLSARSPRADHPYQQHDEYDQNDRRGDPAGDVCEFRFLSAMTPREATDAAARRLAAKILHAMPFVFAVTVANVGAYLPSSVVAWFAFAFEIAGFRYQQAVGVRIAVHFGAVHFARVRALGFARRRWSFGACVRRAGDALRLLRFGLVEAFAALHAIVQRAVQVRSWRANRQRAFFDRRRADFGCRSAQGATLAGCLYALHSVRSARAWLAFALDGKLHARFALVAAFFAGYCFIGPCCFAQSADFAGEGTLARLVEAVAAAAAKAGVVVEVFTGWATFWNVKKLNN